MKLKYILITVGSMLLLWGTLTLFTSYSHYLDKYGHPQTTDKTGIVLISVIGLGTLLTGVFWKKQ